MELFNKKITIRRLIFPLVYFLLFVTLTPIQAQAERYTQNSVLSNGKWVKIAVESSGIHQISYDNLRQWGFSQPEKVKIYGYGGATLPENNIHTLVDDLPKLPFLRSNSRLFFYAVGPTTWRYNGANKEFQHTNNPYSTKGYYFLTENDESDPQIPQQIATAAPLTPVEDFNDFAVHEKELVSFAKTGRELYGEDFRFTNVQNFPFDIPGVLTAEGIITVNFVAQSKNKADASYKTYNNNILIRNGSKDAVTIQKPGDDYERATQNNLVGKTTISENNNIRIEYKPASGDANVYLNYIRLNFQRKLRLYDGCLQMRHTSALSTLLQYNVDITGSVTSNIVAWDVTTPLKIENAATTINENTFSILAQEIGLKEYLLFDKTQSFTTPTLVGTVVNQNLHALTTTDFIIITHPMLRKQAEELAKLRETTDRLRILVVEPEAIYNEFSSGTPDATAYRRLAKMFFDKNADYVDKPRYLLLFGDGTFDNRLISDEWKNTNFSMLLTYQTKNSIKETASAVVEDYFGLLEDKTGNSIQSDTLNLGIGRLPARNTQEAQAMVNKLKRYAMNQDLGNWKNNLLFIGDDADGNSHMRLADSLATIVENRCPEYITTRILCDSFKKVTSASGKRYPDAKKLFLNSVKEGILLLNYSGHGSPIAWSHEDLLNMGDINAMYNTRLPLWVTATCDFSRFDQYATSAGETLLMREQGGAIALLSTSRIVYSGPNETINKAFIRNIFSSETRNKNRRLGDVMRYSKQSNDLRGEFNNLNFILMGDPSLSLAFPQNKIVIETLNGKPIDPMALETIKAKSTVALTGRIYKPDGALYEDYNGILEIKIFDSKDDLQTLNNDNTPSNPTKPYKYSARTKTIFIAKDSIRNGAFSFSFKVPKEINYSNKEGLVNLYCYNDKFVEGNGATTNFLIGGSDETVTPDTIGPVIKSLYLNHSSFKSGDEVNATPTLMVEVSDPSGINISGNGIGHDVTAMIDNNSDIKYSLNNYFQPTFGKFGEGSFIYNLPALSNGTHHLTFKVWDIENNSSEQTIQFVVSADKAIKIYSLSTSINPARTHTDFLITHDRPENIVSFRIGVYDLQGRVVWSSQQESFSHNINTLSIPWNLTDQNGSRLSAGVYIYRIYLSGKNETEASVSKKLIILPQ